jgi:glycosyltransferase involved in cell wall biosynthesis
MIKLSIVIPIYNVEKYLAKCIESVLNQDIPTDEYEIILINDGSTDSSLQIAEKFVQMHPYIRLISQENQGLSAARNRGLDESKGEYVWFIDSDDWIQTDILKQLLLLCVFNELDMLSINRIRVSSLTKETYISQKSKYLKHPEFLNLR